MQRLDLTLTSALNLALDDALLETAESSDAHPEILRLWEPTSPMVVIGRSSPLNSEVNLDYCQTNDIPVFRRISGGQSIVTATGCLMYAVLIDYRKRPELRMLDRAHDFVTQHLKAATADLGLETELNGTCDLTYNGRKFSGNALRCRRNWFLYHGTILLKDFDVDLISRCLGQPKRQPDYRQQRSHAEFVTTVPVTAAEFKTALAKQFDATATAESVPLELARQLATEKYSDPQWLAKVP